MLDLPAGQSGWLALDCQLGPGAASSGPAAKLLWQLDGQHWASTSPGAVWNLSLAAGQADQWGPARRLLESRGGRIGCALQQAEAEAQSRRLPSLLHSANQLELRFKGKPPERSLARPLARPPTSLPPTLSSSNCEKLTKAQLNNKQPIQHLLS